MNRMLQKFTNLVLSNGAGFRRQTLCNLQECNLQEPKPEFKGELEKLLDGLPDQVKKFVKDAADLTRPQAFHLCDGGFKEREEFIKTIFCDGGLTFLRNYRSSFLIQADKDDGKKLSEDKIFWVMKEGTTKSTLPKDFPKPTTITSSEAQEKIKGLFKEAMENRTMYIIPFLMGPLNSPFSIPGVQLTDSAYVALCMSIMTTKVGKEAFKSFSKNFIKGLHSCGRPEREPKHKWWPCDPERAFIVLNMESSEFHSYGSGYPENSLLANKYFGLSFGSYLSRFGGNSWLPANMMIVGIKREGCRLCEKKYVAIAFPTESDKIRFTIPKLHGPEGNHGLAITCVGNDTVFLYVNQRTSRLHALNLGRAIFGVASGLPEDTPLLLHPFQDNTIITNGSEKNGGYSWNVRESEPNCTFLTPTESLPNKDENDWNSEGVPISAIIFFQTIVQNLIFNTHTWGQGVMLGTLMKGLDNLVNMFGMGPFLGLNAGTHFLVWENIVRIPGITLPNFFVGNLTDRYDFYINKYEYYIKCLRWVYDMMVQVYPQDAAPPPQGGFGSWPPGMGPTHPGPTYPTWVGPSPPPPWPCPSPPPPSTCPSPPPPGPGYLSPWPGYPFPYFPAQPPKEDPGMFEITPWGRQPSPNYQHREKEDYDFWGGKHHSFFPPYTQFDKWIEKYKEIIRYLNELALYQSGFYIPAHIPDYMNGVFCEAYCYMKCYEELVKRK